jgi:1-acyl-sn-glycerol-3-phosphate acyltransferase
VPRKTNVFAAAKWEHVFFVGWLIRQVDGIFVKRGEVDRRALGIALKILKSGGALGVAPEGTRSCTGGLIQGKPGIIYMASRANAPIIPIGVSGQLNFHKKLLRLQRLHLRVNIGAPMRVPPISGANKTQQFQDQADRVMVAIARLIAPELRGIYADAAEADSLQTLS